MKKLLGVSLLVFLMINFFGCESRNESEIEPKVSNSNIKIYENVERDRKSYTWYDFRENLPLEEKEKWSKIIEKDDKIFIIISGGYKSDGGYDLEISNVKEIDEVMTISAELIRLNEGSEAFYTPISVVIVNKADFDKEIEVKWR